MKPSLFIFARYSASSNFSAKKTISKAFFGRGLRLDAKGNEWCTKILGSKMQHSLRWKMSLSISANRKDAAAKNYFPIHLTKAHLSKRRRRESFSGFYSPPPHFLRKYTVKVYTRWLLLSRLFSLPAQHMPCTALPVPPPLSLPTSFRKASCLAWAAQPNPTHYLFIGGNRGGTGRSQSGREESSTHLEQPPPYFPWHFCFPSLLFPSRPNRNRAVN